VSRCLIIIVETDRREPLRGVLVGGLHLGQNDNGAPIVSLAATNG